MKCSKVLVDEARVVHRYAESRYHGVCIGTPVLGEIAAERTLPYMQSQHFPV